MIPLRDDQPTATFPIITIMLIVINVIVFLNQGPLHLEESYAMVPYEITHHVSLVGTYQIPGFDSSHALTYGQAPRPIWLTIFTSMFLHGGILHIAGNMLYLWIFGNNIEDVLGKFRFILFYFVCGLAAAVAQITTDPNSMIPTIGASGAIAGVLGAYILLYPNARVFSIVPIFGFGFFTDVRAFWVLALWIALQIFQGFSGEGMARGGGIAYFAHMGGFAAGLVLIIMLGGKRLLERQRALLYRNRQRRGLY